MEPTRSEKAEAKAVRRIAILSDTHDNFRYVERALDLIRVANVDLILHCGDVESARTAAMFPSSTHFVKGNCDHDVQGIERALEKQGGVFHGHYGILQWEGLQIAFLHGDDQILMRDLLQIGTLDFLFHGHTHRITDQQVGRTRVVNPGALYRVTTKTFALLDATTREIETVVVDVP